MLADGPTAAEAATTKAHFDYLQALTRRGVVHLAARTLTADETTFGIVILSVESEDEARRIVREDPAVRDGVMHAELFPCRVALWGTEPQE